MRRALPWILGGALVLGAGALTALTPSDDALIGPFVRAGSVGETVESRTLNAAVTDATFADAIEVPGADWQAEGNWLVVTIAASAPRSEEDAAIQLATLEVDGRVFQASERPAASLRDTDLRVGIDTVGTLAFELPPDVDAGRAELRLTTDYITPELDDLVVIGFELDDLPRVPRIEITDPGLGAP